MMQGNAGNNVPNAAEGNHSRSDSGSYTYSTSAADDNQSEHLEMPGQRQLQQQQQQQQQQFSPAEGQEAAGKSASKVTANKKAAAKGGKATSKTKRTSAQMEEGEGNEANAAKRHRGLNNLPGARKVQAIATMAATPASADAQRVTIYLFFFYSFLHMLFIILSCVLSQLDVSGKGCYTFWGFKADCDAVSYTIRSSLLQNKQLKQNLQAGAAMSILAVLTAVGSFCVAWLLVIRVRVSLVYQKKQRRYAAERNEFHDLDQEQDGEHADKKTASYVHVGMLKWVAMVMMGVNLVFELIAWCIIAALYSARPGEDKNQPRGMTYGVGFGLGITAWVCQVLVLAVFSFVV